MSPYLEVILRTILAFCWLWAYTKLLGRRLISHSSHHLFVLSMTLGTIGGNMAFNINIKMQYFLLSLLLISGIGYSLMQLSLKSQTARKLISGEPVVIIKDGLLVEENLLKYKYSMEALEQGLRGKDVFDVKEVEYAILEINGALSVLKKKEYRSLTPRDLNPSDSHTTG
ncbi:DUF421 domain-containing protein [Paenibacillus sp. GD4]|jgi:uncharacterized membrane protein YcaP (DUF421 family)|uniref:DUF421 domain-containing protein n=1 Tax=Paenibacillus sp. GD4 TaxID=3068890 RepID=UPI00358EBEF8